MSMNLTISVDSSRKPGGQHAQGNLAANIKCLNIIFFKIQNMVLKTVHAKSEEQNVQNATIVFQDDLC